MDTSTNSRFAPVCAVSFATLCERMKKIETIRFAFRTGAAFGATEVFGLATAGSVVALSVQSTTNDTGFFGCFLGVAAFGFLVTALPCVVFAAFCAAVARFCGWFLSLTIAAALTVGVFFVVLRKWPHGSDDFTNVLLAFSIASGIAGMAAARATQAIWNRRDAQQDECTVPLKAAPSASSSGR